MNRLFLSGLSFFLVLGLYAQTQGISYQAVIIDKSPQEVPGRDITGNIMPNHPLMIRFSILDQAGTIEYQEEHSTATDMYGMITLVIGKGKPTLSSPGGFNEIDWNGTPKSLKVDLSLSETEVFYTDFSIGELNFVPYAYHKNITATGSLIVDGMTNLKSRLDVSEGSPAYISGDLTVNERTTLHNDLTVNSFSNLNGQVTINPDYSSPGSKSDYGSYPLRVEGGSQGIAVKIDGSRNSDNYFVTFWDDVNIQGRIEGQTIDELDNDPEYVFENILLANEIIRSTVDVGIATAGVISASSSSTVCAGLGACVTAPVPSLIAAAIAQVALEASNLALVVSNEVLYNNSKRDNIGVTYQSGAGDYAEWLPKSDINEIFLPGDIVGVKNGFISKNTYMADHYMVISRNPIVLGNMPAEGKESGYEKVAFMGQVPVKVYGKVNPGDFIIPAEKNNGTGLGVAPGEIRPDQFGKIVGVAWTGSDSDQYGYINLAVGLNANIMAQLGEKQEIKIREQEEEIRNLNSQIDRMNQVLSEVVPGYAALIQNKSDNKESIQPVPGTQTPPIEEQTVVYRDVTKDQILEGFTLAEKLLKEKGIDVNNHPFFQRIKNEPGYKECVAEEALSSIKKEIEKYYQQNLGSGARIIRMQ